MRQCHSVEKRTVLFSPDEPVPESGCLEHFIVPVRIVPRAFAQAGSFEFLAKVGKRRGGGRGGGRRHVVGRGLSTVTMRSKPDHHSSGGSGRHSSRHHPTTHPLSADCSDIMTLIIKSVAGSIGILSLLNRVGMAGGEGGICTRFLAGLMPDDESPYSPLDGIILLILLSSDSPTFLVAAFLYILLPIPPPSPLNKPIRTKTS